MKKLLILSIILSIVVLSCEKKNIENKNEEVTVTQINEEVTVTQINEEVTVTQINEDRWVSGEDGIRMRKAPDSNSDTIVIIHRADKVNLLEETGNIMTIGGRTGKWSKIEWNNQTGWVFGGFLSKEELKDYNTEGNIFNAYDVSVGDFIEGQEITSIEIKEYDDGTYMGAFIDFKGQMEISGKYEFIMDDVMFAEHIFFIVNEPDHSKMPILDNDTRTPSFMIYNLDKTNEMLDISGNINIQGEATIVIKNYSIACLPADVFNMATVVKVIDN